MTKSIKLYYRPDNAPVQELAALLTTWLEANHPRLKFDNHKPELVVVLGGDGTILEAARAYQPVGAHILGVNVGTVGFLAAIGEVKSLVEELSKVLGGPYKVVERMMIDAQVLRGAKSVHTTSALNDIVVQSPISIVDLEVRIDDHPYQYVRGTGVMIATPTGSTAYNLSAHGPIVMPDIQALILTEILDHNVPTPSLVVEPSRTLEVTVNDFRGEGILQANKAPADVVLVADGNALFALQKGDRVIVSQSAKQSLFVQLDKNQFFKSLRDRFTVR